MDTVRSAPRYPFLCFDKVISEITKDHFSGKCYNFYDFLVIKAVRAGVVKYLGGKPLPNNRTSILKSNTKGNP